MVLRPGNYWHIFPFAVQARRAIFQEEVSFFDRIPPQWEKTPNSTEMFWTLRIPGTDRLCRYYLLGADDMATVSRLVGSNPLGVTYSEAAQIDPSVRALVRPALAANGGWELYQGTPRGKNWFYQLYLMALKEPDWFADFLTADHCFRDAVIPEDACWQPDIPEDGSPVISPAEIDADRRSNIAEEWIQQEYYCSFEGYQVGTIYGDLIRVARAEGRIGRVPYDPAKAVGVMLDIGRTDLTAIWFYQVHGSEIRFIDYWAARGETAGSTIRFLKENRPYHYGRIVLPHDAKEQRYQTSQSVSDEFQDLFRCDVVVADRLGVQVGISTVRKMFPRFIFDEAKCSTEHGPNVPSGLDSLGNYHRKWDEDRKDYAIEPVHDQYSHGADALRTGMAVWQEGLPFAGMESAPITVETYFDPRMPLRGGRHPWAS
jgi:hypothetical protein